MTLFGIMRTSALMKGRGNLFRIGCQFAGIYKTGFAFTPDLMQRPNLFDDHALSDTPAQGLGRDLVGDRWQHLGMHLSRSRTGLAAPPLDRLSVDKAQLFA